MQHPKFWYNSPDSVLPIVLWPLEQFYSLLTHIRTRVTTPWNADVPVICVGNLVVGGSGKTPTAISVAQLLIEEGRNVHFLSRGYGGHSRSPLRVDPAIHGSNLVGDEPLLLAQVAPTWVSGNRRVIAKLAIDAGADILVMDDGFQNPTIYKDFSIVVIDGERGFGNGRLLPGGPLREGIVLGLGRADAVVILGKDKREIGNTIRNSVKNRLTILSGKLDPHPGCRDLIGKRVFGFSGIGNPEKFFTTLKEFGCIVSGTAKFSDHHYYTQAEVNNLIDKAKDQKSQLITTSKDMRRLNHDMMTNIREFPVELKWKNIPMVKTLLGTVKSDIA